MLETKRTYCWRLVRTPFLWTENCKSLKQDAQEVANEIGIPLSTIVIVNLKGFVRSRSLTISALPRLRPGIEKELGLAIEDYNQGKRAY